MVIFASILNMPFIYLFLYSFSLATNSLFLGFNDCINLAKPLQNCSDDMGMPGNASFSIKFNNLLSTFKPNFLYYSFSLFKIKKFY